jgi:hypothetical protein
LSVVDIGQLQPPALASMPDPPIRWRFCLLLFVALDPQGEQRALNDA